ncbi:MAG: PilN domain-containing protein [Bacillota bacterium]
MSSPNTLSFLPDGYFEQKAQRRANAICAVLFIIVMAGMWAAFTISERATRRVEQEYTSIQQQYTTEAQRIVQLRQMQEKQKRMAHQAELASSLLERIPRSNILAEITNCCEASGVSLLDLQMDSKERPKPAKPVAKTAFEQQKAAKEEQKALAAAPIPEPKLYDVNLKLTGVTTTDVQVAQFLKRLSGSRLFRDVNLVISEEFAQADEKLRKFQIELSLDPNVEVPTTSKPTNTAAIELNH